MSKTHRSPARNTYVVGVDLGGTKISAGVFDRSLKLLGQSKITTKPDRGAKGVMDRIQRCVMDAVDETDIKLSKVAGIGVGAPGAVDARTGRVIFAPNLGWRNVQLKSGLESRLHRPVFVENDCNVCTLGVHRKEYAGKPRHMVGIFLGTGIGGGLILNGELFKGSEGTAGELGHMIMDPHGPLCQCGAHGCLESFAGRASLVRHIQAAIRRGEKSVLTEISGKKLRLIRSNALRKAVTRRDKCVRHHVHVAAEYVGKAAANVTNLLNPELVVIGGGLMEALEEYMMPVVNRVARSHLLAGTNLHVKIVPSKLGDLAGVTGAAVLALQSTSPKKVSPRTKRA